MNPLLNDYYAREKNAMALYDDTVKAAQGNAAMGANPLAPKMTATPGGMMSLSGLMPAGPGTMPFSGDTSQIMSGGFVPSGMGMPSNSMGGMGGMMPMMPDSYQNDAGDLAGGGQRPGIRRGADRWTMGEDGRQVDANTGQHRIKGYSRKQQALPFGGFRAKGGPVVPGRAYVVGENGPEMIVPTSPGMVLPNATRTGSRIGQSPMNRPYAEMPGGSGSLANRPARPVGRSINDPQRATEMAARQLRSRGDLPGAARLLQNGALLNDRLGGLPPLPPMVPAAPAPLPALPSGKLVPGRSAGSMVWQPDQPMTPPTQDATSGQPGRSQPVPMGDSPIQPAQPPTEEPVNPFAMTPLGNYVNPTAGMVPSGFNAMNDQLARNPGMFPGLPPPPPGLYGPEAPPLAGVMRLPGTDYGMVMKKGEPVGSTLRMAKPDAPLPPGMVPTKANRGGITYSGKQSDTTKIPEGIQYEKDAMGRIIGGVYPAYNDGGKLVMRRIDMDGNGVVSPAELSAAQAAGQTPLEKLRALRQRAGGQ
jgi:hypothetical protein